MTLLFEICKSVIGEFSCWYNSTPYITYKEYKEHVEEILKIPVCLYDYNWRKYEQNMIMYLGNADKLLMCKDGIMHYLCMPYLRVNTLCEIMLEIAYSNYRGGEIILGEISRTLHQTYVTLTRIVEMYEKCKKRVSAVTSLAIINNIARIDFQISVLYFRYHKLDKDDKWKEYALKALDASKELKEDVMGLDRWFQ